MRPLIGAGSNGDRPCTRSQDYYKVLLQLLLRMRFDLILWLLVEAVVQLGAISSCTSLTADLVTNPKAIG
jgi:hypothetical protein